MSLLKLPKTIKKYLKVARYLPAGFYAQWLKKIGVKIFMKAKSYEKSPGLPLNV